MYQIVQWHHTEFWIGEKMAQRQDYECNSNSLKELSASQCQKPFADPNCYQNCGFEELQRSAKVQSTAQQHSLKIIGLSGIFLRVNIKSIKQLKEN